MSRILLVEDEPQLLRAMQITLRARGHEVRTAADGRRALSEAAAYPPDLVVLDLGLPDLDGVEVIEGLRGWSSVPIIVLSGRTSGQDKVAALDAGADDYVTKPFAVEELLARMRAVTRRVAGADGGPAAVEIGRYRVDLAAKQVLPIDPPEPRAAQPTELTEPSDPSDPPTGPSDPAAELSDPVAGPAAVHLTPTEWRLLEALVRHPGKLVGQRQLLTDVWGPAYTDDTSSLRLYMNRLRRKLEPDPSRPRYLTTEPGMGYRYQP